MLSWVWGEFLQVNDTSIHSLSARRRWRPEPRQVDTRGVQARPLGLFISEGRQQTAAYALDFADWAIDQAYLLVLDALDARAWADARAAASSS